MSVKASNGDSHRFDYNGQSVEARMTPSAFIELEDLGFGDINTLVTDLQAKPSFKTMVHVLAASLRGSMPDISFDSALAMANHFGVSGTLNLITKIVAAALPDDKGDEGKGQVQEGAEA